MKLAGYGVVDFDAQSGKGAHAGIAMNALLPPVDQRMGYGAQVDIL